MTLTSYTYDALNRPTMLTYGFGGTASFSYNTQGSLYTVTQNFSGTDDDVTFTYTRDKTGYVTTKNVSNSDYEYSPTLQALTSETFDDLNRLTGASFSYDNNGNLTKDGSRTPSDCGCSPKPRCLL